MYYIRLSEEDPNSIVYYCRNCGHENKNISLDSVTISKTSFKHNKQKYTSIINKYTKTYELYDPNGSIHYNAFNDKDELNNNIIT